MLFRSDAPVFDPASVAPAKATGKVKIKYASDEEIAEHAHELNDQGTWARPCTSGCDHH